LYNIQPFPDLLKGCVLWNFTQFDFYVSRNFPKFGPIQIFYLVQEKLQKCVLKGMIDRFRQCRLCFIFFFFFPPSS